ncbi:hypothetical protein [Marinilabilia sp.]|uniref:hypothetical protein n=1 Tax=Marinilabilia sp. TaxID=2021252 RepID=UPI0025C6ECD1|nr:hypothetical protein [Marinilabilia sp.]
MFEEGVLGQENIVTIIIGVVVLSFIIWLITNSYKKRKNNQSPLKKGLDLLKEKYAHKEINEQEFKDREKTLMGAQTKQSFNRDHQES